MAKANKTKPAASQGWQRVSGRNLVMSSWLFSLQSHNRPRAASMPMMVGMMVVRVMVGSEVHCFVSQVYIRLAQPMSNPCRAPVIPHALLPRKVTVSSDRDHPFYSLRRS
jgi:hypothetical protein